MKCKTCYYSHNGSSCNYCLITGKYRNESGKDCTHYLNGIKDYDVNNGCSRCEYYKDETLFEGICTLKNETIKSYRPACNKLKKIRQKGCTNCRWGNKKNGSIYCTMNRTYVNYHYLCPNHQFNNILKGR